MKVDQTFIDFALGAAQPFPSRHGENGRERDRER
jgi:hypothetical protein